MNQLIILAVCLFAGIALRYGNRLPKDAPITLNGFIFHISLPTLIILQFHEIQFSSASFYPVSMAWLLFVISFVIFFVAGKIFQWDKTTVGALILTAGLGNTSFVGFPMVEAFYGKEALKTAVLTDQLGTFLVLSTLGIGTA